MVVTSAFSLDVPATPGADSAHVDPATGNETTGGTGDSQRIASIGGIASSGLGNIIVSGGSSVEATPSAKQNVVGKKAGAATPAASKAAVGARPVASAGTTAPAQAKASAKAVATSAPTAAAQATSGNCSAATAKGRPAEVISEFIVVENVYSPPNFAASSIFTVSYVCRNAAGVTTKEAALTLTPGTLVRVADVPEGTCTATEQDAPVPNTYWRYGTVVSTSLASPPPDGCSPQSVPQVGQSNKAQQLTDFATVANRPAGVRANSFYRPHSGVASISKKALGDGTKLAPAIFEHECLCTDDDDKVLSSGTVKVGPSKEVKIDKLGGDRYKVTEKDVSVTGATFAVEMLQARERQGSPLGQSPQSRPTSVAKTASSAAAKRVSISKAASRASSVKKAAVDAAARLIDFDPPRRPVPCEIKAKTKNTYTMDYASFSVAKKIETPADVDLSTKKFAFGYTCKPAGEDEAKGKMEISGDETATPLGKQLLVGTSCTVIEDETSAQNGDYKVKIVEPQTFTLGEKDAVKALTFTNVYIKPTPSPTPSPSETPSSSEIPTPIPSIASTPSVTATPLVTPPTTPSKLVADPSKPVPPMSNAGKPVPPNVAKPMAPRAEQKAANRGRSLPSAGASVAGVAAVALIAAAGGILILRCKKV